MVGLGGSSLGAVGISHLHMKDPHILIGSVEVVILMLVARNGDSLRTAIVAIVITSAEVRIHLEFQLQITLKAPPML